MASEQATINVSGMSCSHCQNAVDRLLNETEGVTNSSVSLENAQAVVTFDADKVSKQRLIETINETEIYSAS